MRSSLNVLSLIATLPRRSYRPRETSLRRRDETEEYFERTVDTADEKSVS
jgi:hypothetical protein